MMSTSDHSKKDEETMEKLQNSPYAEATRTKNNGGNHLKEQNCYIFSLAMRHLLIQESFEYKRFSTRRIKITTTHIYLWTSQWDIFQTGTDMPLLVILSSMSLSAWQSPAICMKWKISVRIIQHVLVSWNQSLSRTNHKIKLTVTI